MSGCLLLGATNRKEISATVTMPVYKKVVGIKTDHSPTTFGGYRIIYCDCIYVIIIGLVQLQNE